MKKKTKKMKKGVSLIELLVSIVILAIVLSQTFFMQVAGYQLLEGTHRAELASNLAKETMTELRMIPGVALSVGVDTSVVDYQGKTFTKIVEISPYSSGSTAKKVKITVKWIQAKNWVREVNLEGVIQ